METKKILTRCICGIATTFLYWFLFRPPLTFQSPAFWLMFIFGFGIPIIIFGFIGHLVDCEIGEETTLIGIIVAIVFVIFLFMKFVSINAFHTRALQTQLNVTESKEFTDIVDDFVIDSIPRIDESVAENLANRKLGELEDVVSQFEADDYSTLINYNGKPFRVIPLKYSNGLKWLNNRKTGIPGYILIDLISQEATYVKLKDGIKFSPSACFGEDLNKHIKSVYPTAILGEYNFEIDDEGKPFWIVPQITHNFCFNVKTVKHVIVVDALNGKVTKHPISDVPEWIDRALDTSIVNNQINYWGKYKKGWWNSWTTQKGVKEATDLYNFIIQDNDVYLYTGITSANGSDQSNIGFFLVNMRNGKATYTTCASVNEKSAKKAAQAIYPEKKYKATDPLLLNVEGKPTYCTSLKDSAGLVKMYAFVYATDYTIVGYATEQEGMEKAIENYKLALEGKSFTTNTDTPKEETTKLEDITFKVDALSQVVVNGTTSYYIAANDTVYIVPITANAKDYMSIKVGDEIVAKATLKGSYYLVSSFEIKQPEMTTE